jgi:uncharacterized phage protein gp47/JayE
MSSLKLKSQRQIKAEILARLISQLGINDVNPGSVNDVLTDAIAQQDFALYYQIAQVSRLVNLDVLTGQDLDNKAFEYGLARKLSTKTKGSFNILRPVGFVKVSTTFYAGSSAPIAGQTVIDVNDASSILIGSSGTLILGRNSNNEEEVAYTSAPVNMVTFYRYTLTNPLINNHAVEETVILKQGNDQAVLAGTTVAVPATGVAIELDFSLDNDVVVLAGEAELDGVEITAKQPGADYNIGVGAIQGTSAFPNPPFAGARGFNPVKFTTGQSLETDDQLRDRIKNYIQGVTRAVKQAILNAIVGLVDPETAKRVVSASVVLPVDVVGDVKVYIDDGNGFEPSFNSVGFEAVLISANGGEQRLQVDQFPVVKAQVESNAPQPYDMSSGPLTLIYQVGNIQETITFQVADFASAAIATAYEITALINARSTLIEARTAEVGTNLLITAKADTNETLTVIGGSANAILNFPTDKKDTIDLYIDDVLKSKDGQTALLDNANTSPYNLGSSGSYPHYLTIVVDGKSSNPQTVTIQSTDVVSPTAVTAEEICAVINAQVAGLTATPINSNTKIRLQSLTTLSSNSKLQVTGGDMNAALGFPTSQVSGADGDYKFNRELGIIQLATPLVAGQSVSLGSLFTRAKLRAASAELYAPGTGTTLVFVVDGGSSQTITFDGTFAGGKTAQQTADFINLSLKGGTAIVRTVSGINYLEVNTNTYSGSGSIQVTSASTANASFGFPLNQTTISGTPNKAFVVSSSTGPYDFAQQDTLVTVIDNDIVNDTFSIPLNYPSSVTSGSSVTQFIAPVTGVFSQVNALINHYVAFTSGLNTDSSGVIDQVSLLGSNLVRYHFSTVPTNFGNFLAKDLINIQNLIDSENNGFFVIQAIGADYVDLINANGVATTAETGSSTLSQRRRISAYNNVSGAITVSSAFSSTPASSDPLIVIPSTVDNLVSWINNTKITSFSLKGTVEGVQGDTKLQLSSDSSGSDGYIQVTGGNGNNELNFPTILQRGIQAYSYWTGLLRLVHRTIYGDDTDLATYPGYGAAGIIFRVLAPTIRILTAEVKLTLKQGISISSVENDVKSAITGYVNTLGVGEEVVIERIRSAVIAIPGITDVVLVYPTANIAVSDNERADISDTGILIG